MSINRQFSLPNCVLILEGLSTAPEGTTLDSRPELSVLTRFECYFAREKQALVGGLDLLQGLVAATNDCVQACISGVPSATKRGDAVAKVELKPVDGGFELTVPEDLLSKKLSDFASGAETASVQLHLSAVQLFDLMEAIDQLAADQQTLPSLKPQIRPRNRQETLSRSVLVEKSAPVALGAAGVAIAAAALFFVPAPKVPEPKEPEASPPSTLTQPSPAVPPAAAPPAAPSPSP